MTTGDDQARRFRSADPVRLMDLLETAWGIICNARGGNWSCEPDDWQAAAAAFREEYHAALSDALTPGPALPDAGECRTFTGWRPAPRPEYAPAGLSHAGAAPDYWGCIFPDGTVVIRWATAFRSHSVWADYPAFYAVHGHPEYGTVITFADGQPAPDTTVADPVIPI